MPECDSVTFRGSTIEDLLSYNHYLLEEYKDCKAQIRALEKWNGS